MKFNRANTVILFFAYVPVATGELLASIRGAPSLWSNLQTKRKLLGGSGGSLSSVNAYYDPSDDYKCRLVYSVHGSDDEYTVKFKDSEIEVDEGDKVTCSKTVDPEGGLVLPVEENADGSGGLPLSEAEWANEVVRDFDVLWKDSKKLRVDIKIFRDWEALYDNDGCYLNYKYGGDPTKISFGPSEIEVKGDLVICKRKNVDGLLPVKRGLKELKKDIPNKDVEWSGYDVSDADVTWKEGEPLELVIKRETPQVDPLTEDDFKKLDFEYDDLEGVVTFAFTSDEGISDTLEFSGDEVEEEGLVVTVSACRTTPDGLSLPIKIEFDVENEVTWGTRCTDEEDIKPVIVEEAFLTWEDDGSCRDESPDETLDESPDESPDDKSGRRLGERGRVKSRTKRKGR